MESLDKFEITNLIKLCNSKTKYVLWIQEKISNSFEVNK